MTARNLAAWALAGAVTLAAPVALAQRRGPPEASQPPATQNQQSQQNQPATPSGQGLRPLPPDSTTRHKITLGGREREFTATAGTVRLFDGQSGAPQADIAVIAFRLDGEDARTRPVTFAFNGGPGYASAWLNLGALGPWRLPMEGDAASPSAPPVVVDNPDSWLEFTDLVFIDPAGTGYSRILGGDDVRRSLWSVNGDIASFAVTIRRWSENNGRVASPKYLVGESYGGFRAPRIARALQNDQGLRVDGVVLVAPVLDFRRFDSDSLMSTVARLPSYAAAARERKGPITRDDLRDVEAYAATDYLVDLVRGARDGAAVERINRKVADITGLPIATVARYGGRIPLAAFRREIARDEGKVASLYDTSVTSWDADPAGERGLGDDRLLNGLHAPLVGAMVDIYHERLKWVVENGRYQFRNDQAGSQWEGRGNAEAVTDLRRILALDPKFRVLVEHGLTDIVTPYFETKMVLDQIPVFGPPDRVRFRVHPGGHMLYTREASRKAMRDDARAMMGGE